MNKQFFFSQCIYNKSNPLLKTIILITLKVILINHNSFPKYLKFGKYTVINRLFKNILETEIHRPAYPNSPDRTSYYLFVTC